MSSAIVQQNNDSAVAQWSPEQVNIIKQQIAPKCSDGELALFGQVCQRTGLDPFAKQIYAISRKQKVDGQWVEKMSIQTSIDGYRLIADRTGKYAGSETFWCGPDGVWKDVWLSSYPPAAAKVLVYKVGSAHSFGGVARFDSYKQTNRSGDLTSMWAKMPDVMIAKCAESLALRKAFPAELSGLYTREEMMQADNESPAQSALGLAGASRFKFILGKTGHKKSRVVAIANKLGVPASSTQLSPEQIIQLRNQLFADWGVSQGVFNAPQHAMASLRHIEGYDGPDDAAVWDAWEVKVGMKKADMETEAVDAEVVYDGSSESIDKDSNWENA